MARKREFSVKTSRIAGHQQRNNICLIGSRLSQLKTYITNVDPKDPFIKIRVKRELRMIEQLLTKIDKHDLTIWEEIIADKNNLPET